MSRIGEPVIFKSIYFKVCFFDSSVCQIEQILFCHFSDDNPTLAPCEITFLVINF